MNSKDRTRIRLLIATLIGGMALCLGGVAAHAAETPPAEPDPAAPKIADRAVVVPSEPAKGQVKTPAHPKRPVDPGRPGTSPAVKEMVQTFTQARQAFLDQQARLREDLKNAAEEDRKAIRAQIRESLDEWIELQRERAREQAHQMRETGRIPGLREVIQDAGSDNGGRR